MNLNTISDLKLYLNDSHMIVSLMSQKITNEAEGFI